MSPQTVGVDGAAPVSPTAFDAVSRINAPFDIECEITGLGADQRRAFARSVMRPSSPSAWA